MSDSLEFAKTPWYSAAPNSAEPMEYDAKYRARKEKKDAVRIAAIKRAEAAELFGDDADDAFLPVRSEPIVRTGYLSSVYTSAEFRKTLDKLEEMMVAASPSLDGGPIAFRGTSGAAAAYPMADRLKLPLLCVRKDPSHSWGNVEGLIGAEHYSIVDDFVGTGETLKAIIKAVRKDAIDRGIRPPKLRHIFLYACDDPASARVEWARYQWIPEAVQVHGWYK